MMMGLMLSAAFPSLAETDIEFGGSIAGELRGTPGPK